MPLPVTQLARKLPPVTALVDVDSGWCSAGASVYTRPANMAPGLVLAGGWWVVPGGWWVVGGLPNQGMSSPAHLQLSIYCHPQVQLSQIFYEHRDNEAVLICDG